MLFVYNIILIVLLPFILLRLLWKSRRNGNYRCHWKERLGIYSNIPSLPANTSRIWLHAVSVGETNAALPLIEALAEKYPTHHFVLTHTTPTGRVTKLRELQSLLENRLVRVYLPYDISFIVRRFFTAFSPSLGIIMETEIWPNTITEATKKGVKMVLSNARLSPQSLSSYLRFKKTTATLLSRFSLICAQTQTDVGRFNTILTHQHIHATGNLKFDADTFDLVHPKKPHAPLVGVPVVFLASSHAGEEEKLLKVVKQQMPQRPVLLLIVPRHPERFSIVRKSIIDNGFYTLSRSLFEDVGAAFDASQKKIHDKKLDVLVLLGDSMGEMTSYYQSSDVVLMGGTFGKYGGQNLIPPLALGKEVISGPWFYNFEEITLNAHQRGLLDLSKSIDLAWQGVLKRLLHFPSTSEIETRCEQGNVFFSELRGATYRSIQLIQDIFPGKSRDFSPGKIRDV